MSLFVKELNLKFPPGEHKDCNALTILTLENLPRNGSVGKTHHFGKNAEIWQPDDKSDKLFFVERGRVVIYAADRDGRETVLRTVLAGEPFGELCFCADPRTKFRYSTARAASDSTIIEVKLEDFLNYVRQDIELLGRVMFTFCIRLADAERRVEIIALRGAEERLGNALLHLARTRGVAYDSPQPGLKRVMATHDELAGLTALSRQRVTITMNRFRQLRLVSYERNQPLIINAPALDAHLAAG